MKKVIDLEEDEYKVINDNITDIDFNIDILQNKLEKLGYYPTRELVLQTGLNIRKMTKGGQVGQGIHAICLDGPPGAGKSFYAKTYQKLLGEILNSDIKMVSYQCNTSTSKTELYEEINVVAAIAGDYNNAIISGKLVQAIDLVNKGERVIVFLDEYDKAREETDTFLLNFLQDGEIDTTQRGKVKIEQDKLSNMQVIICKNDSREKLSGPLTRRLKFLKLDYMKPSILCKTINRVLADSEFTIRDAVTLLYSAMYENMEEFPFSRLPSCSECMQAIKDAESLMEIGADSVDIVTTAIIANLVKDENDIELLMDLTKRRNELIEWYRKLIEAFGKKNSKNELDYLKQEMARSFYPEQLRNLTKELNEQKEKLEKEEGKLRRVTSQYQNLQKELISEKERLKKQEEDLMKRENEIKILRDNAAKDAKDGAEKYLQLEREKMEEKYQRATQELKQQEEETYMLRDNAEKDAMKKAEETIQAERKQREKEFERREQKLKADIQCKINDVNAEITEVNAKIISHNYDISQSVDDKITIKQQELELQSCKKLIEKLLGRPIQHTDFEFESERDDEQKEQVKVNEDQNFIIQELIDGEIQRNDFAEDSTSVFDSNNNSQWTEIGHVVIEENSDLENMVFNEDCARKLSQYLKEKQGIQICEDGLIIYKGIKTNLVAMRILEQKDYTYKNIYRFYSNTMVIPIQSIVTILNLIGNINRKVCGCEVKNKKPIEIQFDCIICSSKKHNDGKEHKFTEIEDEIYILNYHNESQTSFKNITDYLFKGLNCTTRDMSQEEKDRLEKEAFVKHFQYCDENNDDIIKKMKKISLDAEQDIGLDK